MTSRDETLSLLKSLSESAGWGLHWDLHVHSTISDGSKGFKELITDAKLQGLSHIAFTNHDTVVGLDYAIDLGRDYDLEVIGGIEISAWDRQRKKKVHILGYGLSSAASAVRELCLPMLHQRNRMTHWQMEQLLEAGFEFDTEKALEYSHYSTAFYKQHLMTALTDAPYGSAGYKELYETLFKGSGICARDIEYVDACSAVRAIVEDGGVAVLAHPGQMSNYDVVPDLVDAGLEGIEKYHPDHTKLDYEMCDKLATCHELFFTQGSDYHGIFGSIPQLGFAPKNGILHTDLLDVQMLPVEEAACDLSIFFEERHEERFARGF